MIRAWLVIKSENGDAWIIIGTDSGFEGKTTLYYSEIIVRLKEV